VEAHDATSGKVVWTSPVQPALTGQYSTAMCAALGSGTLLVASFDGLHLLNLSSGNEIWHSAVAGAVGTASNPVIVNDPAIGPTVYLTDNRGVIALIP
jgi:outer membrane protein assembly factor BamB